MLTSGSAVKLNTALFDFTTPIATEEVLLLNGQVAGLTVEAVQAGGIVSVLVPGGGLAAHEGGAIGAHTLSLHVGQQEPALAMRLLLEPNIRAAGSFSSRSAAEAAIADVLAAREAQVAGWLTSGGHLPGLTHQLPWSPGVSLVRGQNDAVSAFTVLVVLRRDPSLPTGFRILTSYPRVP